MRVNTTTRAVLGLATAFGLAASGPAAAAPDGPAITHDITGAYSPHLNGMTTAWDGDVENNSMAVSPDESTAVVTRSGSTSLRVLNLTDPTAEPHEITGYVSPRDIAFAPDGASILVTDSTLGVLDRRSLTGTLLARLPLGAGAFGTSLSKDGHTIYVNNRASGAVTSVDLVNQRPVFVGNDLREPRQGVRLTDDERFVYVTDIGADRISKRRTDQKGLPQVARTSDEPGEQIKEVRAISVRKDDSLVYAADTDTDQIFVLDARSEDLRKLRAIPVGEGTDPYGATLAPNERFLLTGNKTADSVTVIDTSVPGEERVLATIPGVTAPRQAISVSRDSTTAWVLQGGDTPTVAVLDLSDPSNPSKVGVIG